MELAAELAQALANAVSKRIFPAVVHLDMFVTEDCNCRCPYCFIEGKRPRTMSKAVAAQAVRFLFENSRNVKRLGILFFGGEPLLEFDTMRFIVEQADEWQAKSEKEVTFSITTNGTLLDAEKLEFMHNRGVKFLLSMDGNRQIHDKYRKLADGTPTFDFLVDRLRWFKSYQPWMGVRLTVTPEGCDTITSDIEFLYKKGINQFIIGPVTGMQWTCKQLIEYERALFATAELYLAKKRAKEHFRMTIFESELEEAGSLDGKWGCGAGRGRMSISATGGIQGCAKIQGAANMQGFWPIGNVFDGFGNLHNRMKMCLQNENARKSCMNCESKDGCSGGCPAVNFVETGNPFKPSEWNCEITRITLRLKEHVKRRKEELGIA